MKINLTINKRKKSVDVPANRTLMDLLRSMGLWSVKHGCETGDCGSCTVLVNGQTAYSCLMLAAQAQNKNIETFEAVSDSEPLSPLKDMFMDYIDLDCSFCLAGFMLSIKALLDKNPEPTEEEIVDALSGVICRCSKKPPPVDAMMKAIKKIRGNW
ncbi:MAG: (2Fe-2S)-binding protein [bacterium]